MKRFGRSMGLSMAAASLLLCGAASAAEHGDIVLAQLSGPERDSFITSSIQSCSDSVRQANPGISAAIVTSYCTCMAQKEADMTTPADVAYMTAHNGGSPDYIKRVAALAPACKAAAGVGG